MANVNPGQLPDAIGFHWDTSGVHMTDAGYGVIASLVEPYLSNLLFA